MGKAKKGGSSEGEKRMRVMQVMQSVNFVLATYLMLIRWFLTAVPKASSVRDLSNSLDDLRCSQPRQSIH